MRVRFLAAPAAIAGLLIVSACTSHESAEQRHRDANTPAGKAGQAAHKVAVKVDKAGRVVGRKLEQAAHDAREGWNEEARKRDAQKSAR